MRGRLRFLTTDGANPKIRIQAWCLEVACAANATQSNETNSNLHTVLAVSAPMRARIPATRWPALVSAKPRYSSGKYCNWFCVSSRNSAGWVFCLPLPSPSSQRIIQFPKLLPSQPICMRNSVFFSRISNQKKTHKQKLDHQIIKCPPGCFYWHGIKTRFAMFFVLQ